MEISDVEAAVCIKALKVAARAERAAGDEDLADAFLEVRAALWTRYCVGRPAPLTPEELRAAGGRVGDPLNDPERHS